MKKYRLIYSFIIVLILWQFMACLDMRHIVPKPLDTFAYLFSHFNILAVHATYSLLRILCAIAITMFLGTFLGMSCALRPLLDHFISPVLYVFYPIPKIAFLPVIMMWFGLGNLSKVILVSLILFFQIAITARDTVKNIPKDYFLTFTLYGATKYGTLKHLLLPALLPSLLTALRISIGTSISVLFFAENFATVYGIGYFIMDAWLKLNYAAMFAGITVISLMGILLFSLVDYIATKLCKWH